MKIFQILILKTIKAGNRPHYYCFKDKVTDLYFMIPMSSKVTKYRMIIKNRSIQHKRCDIIHISRLSNNKDSVFLIQDMFPITNKYIEREYTIANNHLILSNQKQVKLINKKAHRVFNMLMHGIKFTPTSINIQNIIKFLKN